MYTPVNPSFTVYKWGLRGSSFRDGKFILLYFFIFIYLFFFSVAILRNLTLFAALVRLCLMVVAFSGHLHIYCCETLL